MFEQQRRSAHPSTLSFCGSPDETDAQIVQRQFAARRPLAKFAFLKQQSSRPALAMLAGTWRVGATDL